MFACWITRKLQIGGANATCNEHSNAGTLPFAYLGTEFGPSGFYSHVCIVLFHRIHDFSEYHYMIWFGNAGY